MSTQNYYGQWSREAEAAQRERLQAMRRLWDTMTAEGHPQCPTCGAPTGLTPVQWRAALGVIRRGYARKCSAGHRTDWREAYEV